MRGRAVVVALWLAGCGGATSVAHTVQYAPPWVLADVPLVYVVAPEDAIATPFVRALGPQGARVARASAADVEQARATGALPGGTLVITLTVVDERRDRVAWVERSGSPSGLPSPHAAPPPMVEREGYVLTSLVVTVAAARNGRELHRAQLRCEDECGGDLATRAEVLDGLAARATALVRGREQRVTVPFADADDDDARAAVAQLVAGHLHAGRLALERAVTAASRDAWSWLDLGQARRVDTEDPTPLDARLAAAADALRHAATLAAGDAGDVTRDALHALDRERRAAADLAAARDAYARNRELASQLPPPAPR